MTFHPGWFGAVMGTAIVGVAAALNPGGLGSLKMAATVVGAVFVVLAVLLTLVVGVPYIWRWRRYPQAARNDLRHPVLGALYATFPGGLLVLAAALANVGPAFLPGGVVTALVVIVGVPGILLAFLIGVVFIYLLWVADEVRPEQTNGGWFIPPVVNIIVPLVLAPLAARSEGDMARFLALAGYAAWGIGFFLFVLVAALLFGRLFYHPLPPAALAPSLWIGLGPIGVGSLALVRLAQAGKPLWGDYADLVGLLSALAALALWGFGLWWLAMAAVLLQRYRRNGLPYGIGWWAFTFPLGAYTVSTLNLARVWAMPVLEGIGVLLFFLLLAFWTAVSYRTLHGLRTGEVWRR
jgi:C4-dicarboxylate transporter/malic acid transport protein